MVSLNWNVLPAEMKYSVVELLTARDTAAFAKASREAYELSIPTMFTDIKLSTYEALRSFVLNVPAGHCRYVRTLHLEVAPSVSASVAQITHTLHELLVRCVRVEELTLRIAGSLKPSIIPCFAQLRALTKLSVANIGQEETSPLSERLVVSIAASVPNLADLTLDRITRSALHAPELLGACPFLPVVLGDDDIPAHPLLGAHLSLPALLQLPALRALRIRDTHLGDPAWARAAPRCRLDTLALGGSCYEPPAFNRACAERILACAGRALGTLSLGAALSGTLPRGASLARLRSLHIAPELPLEHLAETLAACARAPVAALALECHADDAEDMCGVLEDFLSACVERRDEPFFAQLADVSLCTVGGGDGDGAHEPACASKPRAEARGAAAAIERMQDYVRDIRSLQKTQSAGAQASIVRRHPELVPSCESLRR